MPTRCTHCGSDRPAVDDRVFRLACPACGGPRLPESASFRDDVAEQVATRALFRARIRAWRSRARLRVHGLFAALMTIFMVVRLSHAHHVRLVPVVLLGLLWAWFVVSFVRRHQRRAWRVRGALDDAYALAGLGTQLAMPRVRIRAGASAPAQTQTTIDAQAEELNDPIDALADFDRRLAAGKPT